MATKKEKLEKIIIKDEDLCYWYKSISLTPNNPYTPYCHHLCNGIRPKCPKYISKRSLKLIGGNQEGHE